MSEYDSAVEWVKTEIRTPMVSNISISQMGVAMWFIVLTCIANLMRNRTLCVVYGVVICFIAVALLSAATTKNINTQRFLMACNIWLTFTLLRGVTFVFGWHVFRDSLCVLYDMTCVATAILSVVKDKFITPSAIVFCIMFFMPHDGASPFIEPMPIACMRTSLMFCMFFVLQFLSHTTDIRHPDNPEIDSLLCIPRFAFCLTVHPMFWTAAPVVACVLIMKKQVKRTDVEAPVTPVPVQTRALAPVPAPGLVATTVQGPITVQKKAMYSATAVRFDPKPRSGMSQHAYLPSDASELRFLNVAGNVATIKKI